MKASVKFLEDRKPLMKAKVPLTILGFPFESGIEAGEAKEMCLHFRTFSDAGPIVKFSYRPNDSLRPFSLGIKIGTGRLGSPLGAAMTTSAEFSFLGNGGTSFFLRFSPRVGDFSIKQRIASNFVIPFPSSNSVSSLEVKSLVNNCDSDNEENYENRESPMLSGGEERRNSVFGKRICDLQTARATERLFSGTQLQATTALPLRDRAMMNLRWQVKFPAYSIGDQAADSLPYLSLSKIGIEHLSAGKPVTVDSKKTDDEAGACVGMLRRELDALREERCALLKEVEDLQPVRPPGSEIAAGILNCAPKTAK